MFEKTKEIYDNGELVAELFKRDFFIALVSGNRLSVTSKVGPICSGKKGYIEFEEKDFEVVRKAIKEWGSMRDSLWGRVSHGSAMAGHTSTTYYPPGSEDGMNFKKEKDGSIGKPDDVGRLEEKLSLGDLEFTFERFQIYIERDDQYACLSGYQMPLLEEAFALYTSRRGVYAPRNIEDVVTIDSFGWHEL